MYSQKNQGRAFLAFPLLVDHVFHSWPESNFRTRIFVEYDEAERLLGDQHADLLEEAITFCLENGVAMKPAVALDDRLVDGWHLEEPRTP